MTPDLAKMLAEVDRLVTPDIPTKERDEEGSPCCARCGQIVRVREECDFPEDAYCYKCCDEVSAFARTALPALAARVRELEAIEEAARRVTRSATWLPNGADSMEYQSTVSGVVGSDWEALKAALAAARKEG